MRQLSFLIALLWLGSAQAEFMTCSEYVNENPAYKRSIDYLKEIEGRFELGSCKIELHICQFYDTDNSGGSIVGDILIQGQRGDKIYAQLEFPRYETAHTRAEVLNGSIMFHYESDDLNRNRQVGLQQSFRLEFLKTSDGRYLKSIEAGLMDRHDRNPSYRWILCHGKHQLFYDGPVEPG